MGVRWLLNFGLLALPIGVTLGVLMSIQQHRTSSGKSPLFQDNDVTMEYSCAKSGGIVPPTKGQEYTLNPNQWGWNKGDDGELCIYVDKNNNKTYATNTTAPLWSVTWDYPRGPVDAPVHAFPNIKLEDVFPLQIKDMNKIDIDFKWTYGVGKNASKTTEVKKLESADMNANVAMDMFLDKDKTRAGESTKASHEVMVWFAAIGTATQPLGLTVDEKLQPAVKNMTIDDTKFGLWMANNSNDQIVLTWMSYDVTTEFKGDLWPLVDYVMTADEEFYPSTSDYMGYMSWGTEAYSANKSVTFDVPRLSIDVGSA
ncbi:hypothetical protein QQX98_011370 [Neonectria punicea]|uniref:Uncharacterized protein n=1 Tax=Neonectria punicea TaxID=979145 RepID=A0ABR1GM47_9HYPO